jgi:hypothetical protein
MKPAPAVSTRRLIDDKEGARLLGVSRSQFRRWIAAGLIPRVRAPADANGPPLRRLLVEEADLFSFIDRWKEHTHR